MAVGLCSCGRDPDDSGRGEPAGEPVAFIETSDGPVWLGAPPASATVDDKVLADVARGVAAVRAVGCGPVSQGSAFAVAPGLLVGAAHVVTGAPSIEIEWAPGAGSELTVSTAAVVGYDTARDLVLLRSDAEMAPLRVDRVRLGISGAVIGYRQGQGLVVSPARIEHHLAAFGWWGEGTKRNVYLVAADVRTGQSGGPLIDRDGSVVGVAFASVQGPRDIAFALSRGELLGFLASAGVDVQLNYLGETVITAQPGRLEEAPHGECRIG
ncbi:S1 family peptidase [Candidatus Poriferisodalis sp.]|uniref:S1 family peptidase n=1 Tax=Candidatus Poriferisodalis sp. TaxID=3101277 RepID=UPI003B014333